MNSTTDSDPNLRLAIQPYHHHHHYDVVSHHSAAATSAQLIPTTTSNKPRKKRSKVVRAETSPKSPSRLDGVSAPKREKRPEITMPCSECGKRFWSWKALFGHMRCHPERQWRGINPPPNLLRYRHGRGSLSPPLPLPPPPQPQPQPQPPPLMAVSEEDSDVAACLLLLANAGGPNKTSDHKSESDHKLSIVNYTFHDHDHDHDHQSQTDRFECSSCKKVFGSHQALGGHRASHKNVKGCFAMAARADDEPNGVVSDSEKKTTTAIASTEQLFIGSSSPVPSQHQCGICLRIFSSGQALGGHKRCHWEKGNFNYATDDEFFVPPLSVLTTTAAAATATATASQALDLNLPPRMEDMDQLYYSSSYNNSSPAYLDLRLGL